MLRTVGLLGWLALCASTATAQFAYPLTGSPYLPQGLGYNPAGNVNPVSGRPAISPYLNLLNGNFPALNYYGGVRPLLPNINNPQQLPPMIPPLNRSAFFQGGGTAREPKLFTEDENAPPSTTTALRSPGGPVSFGNYSGSSHAGLPGGTGGFFNRPSAQQPRPRR